MCNAGREGRISHVHGPVPITTAATLLYAAALLILSPSPVAAEVRVSAQSVDVPCTAPVYDPDSRTFDVTAAVTNTGDEPLDSPFALTVENVPVPGLKLVGIDGEIAGSRQPFVAAGLEKSGKWLSVGETTRPVVLQFDRYPGEGFKCSDIVVHDRLTPVQVELATASSDMRGMHEADPHGVPPDENLFFNWQSRPRINLAAAPAGWDPVVNSWGQVYIPVEGNPATNTRVEIRDLQLLGLCRSTGKWLVLRSRTKVSGAYYLEDFGGGDAHLEASVRLERDGGNSVRMRDGFNFHFFDERRPFAPADMPLITRFRARLVRDSPLLPDDRWMANFIADAGGDYWRDLTAQWAGTFINNQDFAISKFKYVTSEYRTFYARNLSQPELLDNPPPDWTPMPEWYPKPRLLDWRLWAAQPNFGDRGRDILLGDFDGNGTTDASFYSYEDGTFWVASSNGYSAFSWNPWAVGTYFGDVHARMRIGDFNGDGKSDVFFLAPNGHYVIGLSRGRLAGSDANTPGAFTWTDTPAGFTDDAGMRILVGDFNGDGLTDAFFYDPRGGRLWVGLSNGDGTLNWSSWGTAFWGDVSSRMRIGDFNGDGKDDIYFFAPNGHYLIGLSNGSNAFTWTDTPTGFGDPGMGMLVGDFNGDGKSDVFFYFHGDGNHWVGLSNGDGTLRWSVWGTHLWGDVTARMRVGDFNGDGKSDLFFFAPNRHYLIGMSDGKGDFSWTDTPTGFADDGERVLVGDFDGDGRSDAYFFAGDGNNWVWLNPPPSDVVACGSP